MNKYIKKNQEKKTKKRNKTFHYTNENMVKDLIKIIPFRKNDIVLDAGSGKNKVFYNNIPTKCKRNECEIEDGKDFFDEFLKYDWLIGNPPFNIGWKFIEKASEISKKGMAFLGNINFFNSLTPKRLEFLKEKGFTISKIHLVADKRWYGRYYFIIFTKDDNKVFSWNLKTYK